ncbi:uncharacterized protein LOC142765970 [Rhipicephalus microplus]|uniref:uncharacterized protein LOC142765970 n=1 Tax=Rhipicephalus microplus TaxID=6941 RepID=UPI003F6D8D2F
MSFHASYLAFYFTILWLESLVGNSLCAMRNPRGPFEAVPGQSGHLAASPGGVVAVPSQHHRPSSPMIHPSSSGPSSPVSWSSQPSSPSSPEEASVPGRKRAIQALELRIEGPEL